MDPYSLKLECLKLAARNEAAGPTQVVDSARQFYDWITERDDAGSAASRPAETPHKCLESTAD